MLYLSLLFLLLANAVEASSSCPVETFLPNACGVSKETVESVHSFQEEITQKSKKVLEDTQFQKIVSELKQQMPRLLRQEKHLGPPESQLYVFISFSLGEKALLNLAQEAKHYGAPLVLRGFKDGSYLKTIQALQKIILKTGQGVIIDPELFALFAVTAVPTFILAKPLPFQVMERLQTPRHDRLQGHVSIQYTLESFAKDGSLKDEARILLRQGGAL